MRPVCRFLHLTVVVFLMCSCGERSTPPTDLLAGPSASRLVLAHRGSSGYLPEHTLAAYAVAHSQGADFIETDVVMTRDGVLICSHDLTLEKTTDIEQVFPERASSDGKWYAIDFTLAELQQIRRHGNSGGVSAGHRIVTLRELIGVVQELNTSTGRTVGLIPELKDPGFHTEAGKPMEAPLLTMLGEAGYETRSDLAIIQTFDLDSLRRIRNELGSELRLVYLSGKKSLNDAALDDISSFADGIGPNRSKVSGSSGRLVERAHARGLTVFAYTFKDEPEAIEKFYERYGVDGLFVDYPEVAVSARDRVLSRAAPEPAEGEGSARIDEQANPCVVPVFSTESRGAAAGWGAGFMWMDQHEDINASAQAAADANQPVDVVLLGDSITQSWGGAGRSVGSPGGAAREKHFGQWTTLNFGISGDRTQHLLWRIQHGNFNTISPRVVVLMIGTNNLSAGDTNEQIAEGVEAVVGELLHRLPDTQVILCAVLPRGKLSDDPMRLAAQGLNTLIQPLGDHPRVHWIDPSPAFLDQQGNPRADLMAGDFLHLSPAGYDAWGEDLSRAITESLDE